jgi:3-oxoacyl-(acyl-carrier-protein) synthase
MNQYHDTPREVVVTGLGVVSPYGRGCRAYWQGLSQGRCAIDTIRLFSTAGFRSRIGAEISPETVRGLGTAHRARATRLVIAAAEEAVCQAGLSTDMLAEAAVSIGGAGGGMLEAEAWYWHRHNTGDNRRLRAGLR